MTAAGDGRCPWTIRYGTSAETTTRCDVDHGRADPDDITHSGPGLPEFPGQRVVWSAGDRREYRGDWPGYCTLLGPAPTFGGGCTLPAGHHGRCAP
jgi:hypothetical protein